MNAKVQQHGDELKDYCDRLALIEEKIGQVLVKLAVPLFLVGVVGPVIGGVIVAIIAKGLK